jgi:hypothetical protein
MSVFKWTNDVASVAIRFLVGIVAVFLLCVLAAAMEYVVPILPLAFFASLCYLTLRAVEKDQGWLAVCGLLIFVGGIGDERWLAELLQGAGLFAWSWAVIASFEKPERAKPAETSTHSVDIQL